jgi:hypothetical protein
MRGKNPPKKKYLRIWMFSLEGRRSPKAWKSVMTACEETCSAILDFLKVFYNFPQVFYGNSKPGSPGSGFTKKPGSRYHDYGSKTLLKNQLDF